MNQSIPPMNKLAVRQAVAYGLDRATVVKAFYGGRGVVAKEFQPPSLFGYANNVKQYNYDPARSRALLKAAGYKLPVKISFWYPTSVSRPYMPDPAKNFQAFSASLTKAGFKVVPHAAPWNPDYLGGVQDGKAQVYLYGWTGDFGDPDDFQASSSGTPQKQWGFNNKAIFNILTRARDESKLDAHWALSAGEPHADAVPPGCAVRAHEPGARVPEERHRVRSEPGRHPAVLQRVDRLTVLVRGPAKPAPTPLRPLPKGAPSPMLRFVARRILLLVPILLGLSILSSSGSGPAGQPGPGAPR